MGGADAVRRHPVPQDLLRLRSRPGIGSGAQPVCDDDHDHPSHHHIDAPAADDQCCGHRYDHVYDYARNVHDSVKVAPSVIVLGWDSATFDVIDPLVEAGRLPVLSGLMKGGFRAPLRSTWPPMTDCAWTSAFTGRNPGAHGIFGSWYRAPGRYECRYYSSRDRKAPALWELTDGVRYLVWNVPMTFPPSSIDGVMVSGYGAPPGSRFCAPDGVQDEIAGRWPLSDLLDRAPHGRLGSFLEDLTRGLKTQAEALPRMIEETGAVCAVAVWPHIDRAQHFFWQFRGRDHDLAGAVERVYEAMDQATGAVVEAFPEADVIVVSDHGAGTLHGDVNMGAWLTRAGFASYEKKSRRSLSSVAWMLPPRIRTFARRIAPGLARRTMAATLAGQLGPFDWPATKAFVGFHGDLWLNIEGREPQPAVSRAEADEVLAELGDALLQITDPRRGRPVFSAVHRRDDIYAGPAAYLAPDLVLDSWPAGYRIAPGREPTEDVVISPSPLAGVHEPWSADHRPLGIFVAAGPRIAGGAAAELSLYDVCPTALALLETAVPEGLDGGVATGAIEPRWLRDHPVRASAETRGRLEGGDYSDEEAAAVAAHLKDLGYIE
jgi:predicted AlkP superfamily phosphohydrolase/phosphomutase